MSINKLDIVLLDLFTIYRKQFVMHFSATQINISITLAKIVVLFGKENAMCRQMGKRMKENSNGLLNYSILIYYR